MLNRDSFLAADDLKSEVVPVPEMGDSIRIRMMTGAQRDSYAASLRKADGTFDGTGYRAKLLARCLVDESGALMFTEGEVELINSKSPAVIDRLFEVADRLSGTSPDAIKEAEKN